MLRDIPPFYFIRHGQTFWNKEHRFQGRRDIDLNETGQAQADGNGVLLQTLLKNAGEDVRNFNWLVSPLKRTMETANRVRKAFDLDLKPINQIPNLVEISFGVMEGHRLADLEAELPEEFKGRQKDRWHFRPRDGENYPDLVNRISPVLLNLTGPTIIVAHGGVARAIDFIVCGDEPKEIENRIILQDHIYYYENGQRVQFAANSAA